MKFWIKLSIIYRATLAQGKSSKKKKHALLIISLNLRVNKLAHLEEQSYTLMSARSEKEVEILWSESDAHDVPLICWLIIL